MCGFIGSFIHADASVSSSQFELALDQLKHRGPDSSGKVSHQLSRGHFSLGFRRLAIIDLSPTANQPFASADGNFSLVFNGEIYNYLELRSELLSKGHQFRTNSDTEVLFCAWLEWGEGALSKLTGMFSFILFDKVKEIAWCVRDAYGIKPFFYKVENRNIYFASEIKALLPLSKVPPQINPEISADYILGGEYDRSRETFYLGVSQLEPGNLLKVDFTESKPDLSPIRWWHPKIQEFPTLEFPEAANRLREEFCRSVELHLRSDVRVAAALSGGLDSSAIVSVIRKLRPDIDIHTFSYIADDSEINEEKWIDLVNKSTSSVSHKIQISASDFRADLDDLILTQGEPFGSTSLYAQYRVYKAARESGVKVMLDGQGADELLAGYFGYPESRIQSLIEKRDWYHLLIFCSGWSRLPGRDLKNLIRPIVKGFLPDNLRFLMYASANKNRKLKLIKGDFLAPKKLVDIYPNEEFSGRRLAQRLLKEQSNGALVSLLRHADRNSMRWSIESRVPFLTPHLSELVLSFPEHYFLSNRGDTKSVFREAMRGIVDQNILNRKDKIGLATPQNSWVTQELFEDGDLLEGLRTIDFLDFKETQLYLARPHKGVSNIANRKWRILNLIKWKMLLGIK